MVAVEKGVRVANDWRVNFAFGNRKSGWATAFTLAESFGELSLLRKRVDTAPQLPPLDSYPNSQSTVQQGRLGSRGGAGPET